MSSSISPKVGPSLADELARLKAQEPANNFLRLAGMAKRADELSRPLLMGILRNRGYPELASDAGIQLLAECD